MGLLAVRQIKVAYPSCRIISSQDVNHSSCQQHLQLYDKLGIVDVGFPDRN